VDEITLYEVLLFGHLLGVVAWVGANIVLQILSLRASAAGGQRAVDFLADIEWLGTRYFIPISLIVVALGFWLVGESEGAYELSQFWVSAGLGMFLISFLLGAGFLGPESGRVAKLAAEGGPDQPEVQRRISRVIWVARFELLLLILVIFDMVVKPGL
jgi:uncharacterized membrane protein